jgi:hypothetical protein
MIEDVLGFHFKSLFITVGGNEGIGMKSRPDSKAIPIDRFIPKTISPETQYILDQPNAGGTSKRSEAFAMEILYREYQARGVRSENEIKYYSDRWKKCDFITRIKGRNIGVSVARCLPRTRDDPPEYVKRLLYKKLYGLVVARAGVMENTFRHSILFIWCPDLVMERMVRRFFHRAWQSLRPCVRLITRQAPFALLLADFRI